MLILWSVDLLDLCCILHAEPVADVSIETILPVCLLEDNMGTWVVAIKWNFGRQTLKRWLWNSL